MSIAILCGNHDVSKRFTRHMMERHAFNIAFVEMEGHSNVLTQVSINEQVRLLQYKSEEDTIKNIKELGVTTVVLAWWPKIVHKINKLGINVINTHPSYLPYNRGKYPYYWAIVDGTPFGATIHRVDDGIDTGTILWRSEVLLDPTDTGETAYGKAANAMLELLYEHAEDIANEKFPSGFKQDESKATSHFARELEVPPIENRSERAFINDLRARTFDNAHSGRRIIIDGKTYRVHVRLVEDDGHN
jgi:methionyl-tRNA formyltransferase